MIITWSTCHPSPVLRYRDAVLPPLAALWLILATPLSAGAQDTRLSRLTVDTVAAVDVSGSNGDTTTGIVTDALVSFELRPGVQLVARPFLQRLAGSGEWNAQVWIAALRYEAGEQIAVRVDAGFIPSPVGIANLMLRPHTNPTIALPASLFTALPTLEVGGPRTTLLGAVYPLGVSATASSLRWDIRAAVIDSSPFRTRRVFADDAPANPPRLRNVVVGGGVTPIVGVRVGVSIAHGDWEHAGESPSAITDRSATLASLEGDVSFGHTRVQAEWTRDQFAVERGRLVAQGWFAQGTHALSPRWFVAGRVERMHAPAVVSAPTIFSVVREGQMLLGSEETVGYRLSPELTLRGSHRLRRNFGRTELDHSVALSFVWWRRWR